MSFISPVLEPCEPLLHCPPNTKSPVPTRVVLWYARNLTMHGVNLRGANVTLPTGQEPLSAGVFGVSLLQYLSAWLASVFVSYQKDLLMRRNFVILKVVKKDKDRRILALRGQKQSLEVQLTDLEARSEANAANKQHIKFVDEVRPRIESHGFKPIAQRLRSRGSTSFKSTSLAPAGLPPLRLDRRATLT